MLHIKLKRISNAATWKQYFARRPPPPTLGMGSIGQNSNFSEHGHVAYQIKGNHESQHGSKYVARRPIPTHPLTLALGSKFNFSKHVHVAYQIKENHECSNMVANILPIDAHSP